MPESATGTVVKTETETTTVTEHVTRHKVTQTDPYLIERIVGYHEYGKALHYFDRLSHLCDKYEMEAVEEIVRSEPEFAFYTVSGEQQDKANTKPVNARTKPAATTPSRGSNVASAHSKKTQALDRKRHGFRWLTALARVEVGAMRAGFSQHPRPYPTTPGYDANEYRTLLNESARLHFWSLNRDPAFVALSRAFRPTSMTLSYLRRLNIATGFSLTAGLAANNSTPKSMREMSNYAQRLNSARTAIQLKIATYLATPEFNSQSRTNTSTQLQMAELCNNGVCRQFDTN